MALNTRDQYRTTPKQNLSYTKTATRTTIATGWYSLFDLAGNPGAGTLSAGNTANGIVPDQGATGYPPINAFGTSTGELGAIEFSSSVACRIRLFDCPFACGAYAFNANTALTSQPSYSTRVPNGYGGETEIWVEQVTAATGNQAVNVTYTDQSGNTGALTGAVGIGAAPTLGRCWQLPFAAGDSGVQAITNVQGSVASAGTFNVRVLRPLWTGRVKIANDGDLHSWISRARVRFQDRPALYALVAADSTSSGIPSLSIEMCDG